MVVALSPPAHALFEPDTILTVAGYGEALRAWMPGVAGSRDGTGTLVDAVAPHEPVRFRIRLANTEGRRSSASYLVEKMYSWRGYLVSGPPPTRNRITLVASDDERALATITVGFDHGTRLAAEELYPEAVDDLRAQGARLCEFTQLAVDNDRQSREVLAMIFHIAYMYARRLNDCTDVLIEVNPRHVRFYRAMLGFEVAGGERTCPRVDAPAVLLRLRLSYAQEQIARYGGHRELATSMRSLYPLGFSPAEEDGIVGRLRELG